MPIFIRTLMFTFQRPFSVVVVWPGFLVAWFNLVQFNLGPWRWVGLGLIVAGVMLYGWCSFEFGKEDGTPSVRDAPVRLVVHGPYAIVRNPMFLSMVGAIVGEAVLFQSGILVAYAVISFIRFHNVVINTDEPRLERRFGDEFESYSQRVPRWIPLSQPTPSRASS